MNNVPDKKTLSVNNIVEKSKDLVWAKFNGWSAPELRLLEVYLSRINPREPDGDTVAFTMKEYGEFLGLVDLRYEQAKRVTNKLTGKQLLFEKINAKGQKSFTTMTVFERADCDVDPATGKYMIYLHCGSSIKPLFFDIVDRKYIKYRLQNTINMKSQYSITLYSILLDKQGNPRGWSPSLDELKKQLGATAKWYDSFKHFRLDVLEPAIKEINELSNLTVDYTKGLTGRKVTSINFIVGLKPTEAQKSEPEQEEAPAKPSKAKKKAGIDYEQYIPCMGAGANTAGERLRKDIPELFPEIQKDQIDNAVADVLRAVQTKIDNLEEYPEKAGGYAYTIMFGKGKPTEDNAEHRKSLLSDLIPGTYFPIESYFPKK